MYQGFIIVLNRQSLGTRIMAPRYLRWEGVRDYTVQFFRLRDWRTDWLAVLSWSASSPMEIDWKVRIDDALMILDNEWATWRGISNLKVDPSSSLNVVTRANSNIHGNVFQYTVFILKTNIEILTWMFEWCPPCHPLINLNIDLELSMMGGVNQCLG